MTLRVLLADDHALVRGGIRALLDTQSGIEVVGEAATGAQAITQAHGLHPDLILMDIGMPDLDGLEATRRIKAELPEIHVLLLTVHDDANYLYQALEAGASGYLLKGAEVSDLLTALQVVQRGEVYLHPAAAKHLVGGFLQRAGAAEQKQIAELTPRQQEILALVAQGLTNQQIADKLVLSPFTVATHRANIMSRLNLHNRTELVRYALRHGLLPGEQ
ncbi:MAG: response regulator transcription factor [Chloroflexi bacterium]|nr:response regulator transcription factor [Chloroflexota bacterium]